MKKSVLSIVSIVVLTLVFNLGFSQTVPKKVTGVKSNSTSGKIPISTKAQPNTTKVQTLGPNKNIAPAATNVVQPSIGVKNNYNTAVQYDKDGDVLSVDGWKINFVPSTSSDPNGCGTPTPVVQVPTWAKNGTCPPSVLCDNATNRDANIPSGPDPIEFMQLRWTVVLDGAGSPSSNISQQRVDDLMTELNADFLPWKLQFCLDTAIFVSSAQYYSFDGASEENGMKSTLGANYTNVINIYVVNNLTNPSAGGYAYFPYSSYGGTNYRGGVVMSRNNSSLGTHTLGHELGHTFGLHHTFHGVDEVAACSACYEDVGASDGSPASGDDHGDYCSDTNPHETNAYSCVTNPGGSNFCDAFPWANVPVDNHMSYSFCSSQFTPQQAGRMHCMIDAYMPGWLTNGSVTCGSLPPVPDFIASPLIWPQPSNVNFTNLTAGKATVTNWYWDFDVQGVGGVTPATSTVESPPTVTYANTGLYEVKLIATNANGTDSVIKSNYIEVVAPVGDCDTLDFQWVTPTPTLALYSYDVLAPTDSHLTGVPAMFLNATQLDTLGLYERFPTPTPGSSTIGGVRLGLAYLADPNDNMIVDIVVYDDDGTGQPDLAAGPIGGSFGLSPSTDLGVPGVGFYSEQWYPISPAVTLPSTSFHVGINIIPGDVSDTLLMLSSNDAEGEGDSSNYVYTSSFGLLDYMNDIGLDFDLDIIPMMGELAPDPIITSFSQIIGCDTTQVFLFDTVLNSSYISWQITFADGTTWTDTVSPGVLVRNYFGPGPDTITISASNTCGKIGTNSYFIPYTYKSTPVADFSKDMNNPICLPPPTSNCATFTASPAGMASYDWDFGDGTVYTDTGQIIQYCYSAVGSYYVEVNVISANPVPSDTIFLEEFTTGLGGFATFNVDGGTPVLDPPFDNTNATAWVGNGSYGPGEAASTSWTSPVVQADDWMISPGIALNGSSTLYWDAVASDASYPDGYEVRISTTTQTTAGCLANGALFTIANENPFSTSRSIDLALAGYANQTVYIGFRNTSTDQYVLRVDNVLVGTTGLGCANSLQRNSYVDIIDCSIVAPSAAMNTSGGPSGCDSVAVTFSDNSTNAPTSWVWDFNDGNFSTTQNPGVHTFIGVGTYNVLLIATNTGGTDSATFTVTVNATPAIPTAGTNATYCEGDVITDLTATGTSVEWFSDAGLTSSLGTGSPFSPAVSVGTNAYYVTDTENSCQSLADSVFLVVNQAAIATAGSAASICEGATHTLAGSIGGSASSLTWTNGTGDGTFDNANLAAATYTPGASDIIAGTVTLTITSDDPDAGGPCTGATDNLVLTINANPVASIGGSTDILCTGDATGDATASVAGGSGPYTYMWSDPSFQTNVTATGLLAGQVGFMVTDANGCVDTVSTVLTEPSTALSGTTGTVDATCGNTDGKAFITASGGTGTYTYEWDDPSTQTTDTAFSVAAGPYNVTVTDANGCTYMGNESVSDAGAPVTSISNIVHVTCFGANNGSADVSASGGVSPYTYTWTTGGSGTSETGMPGGAHSVTVEDATGCASVVNVTINEPTAVTIGTETKVDISCNSATDGSITITASGGTGIIDYSIDGGGTYPNTTGLFSGLGAGTYNVSVRDSNGCTVAGSALVVSEPTAIIIGSETATNATCNGDTDGTITVTASGGTGTLNYSIDTGITYANTTGIFTGLMAATYGIVVQDSNGCTATGSMLDVTQPTAVSIDTEASTDVACNSGTDGTITITASGGMGVLTYSINSGSTFQSSGTYTGLGVGSYGIVVTDSVGCLATGSTLSIAEPTLVIANATAVDADCSGSNGQVSVSASGGTGAYTYLWDDPSASTTATVTGLATGTYNVIVTDAGGCITNGTATVGQASGPTVTSTATDASCGAPDGTASASAAGGTAPYTYLWDDPSAQNTATATNLAAGTYTVVVTDASGCTASSSVTVNNAGGPTVSTTAVNENCGDGDGTATATASGGTTPYTYLWDDPSAQNTATATGLTAGLYNVIVTDGSGCSSTSSVTVGGSSGPSVTTTVIGSSCGNSDGSATAVTTGGVTPYTYLWDDPAAQTNATATGLGAGSYTVQVTDANGCISTEIAGVSDIGAPVLNSSSNDVTCNGDANGSTFVSASGGIAPYTYQWDDQLFQTTAAATSLSGGTYTVTVTDASGCSAIASEVVAEPSALVAVTSTSGTTPGVCTGSATANVLGGTTPYTYLWGDPGAQSTPTATGLCNGTFSVIILDANGCSITENVTVIDAVGIGEIKNELNYNIYPNPSSGDVFVELQLENNADIEIRVFNAIGEQISYDNLIHVSDYKYVINCTNYAGGIYYVHLLTEEQLFVNKVTIVK